ncbi:MAG: hypothetical protein SFV22_13205 [Saprospiraceae bacterium]|nr:hypothetical protein [Saprospiraceae bacterium]
MASEFHHYILDRAQKACSSNMLLADELMTLLNQSKANIYKKMQGKTPFSMEEYLAISRKYDISLDAIIHKSQGEFQKVTFDYSLPEHQPQSPDGFLEKIFLDLQRIIQIPLASISYASNEVPIFHSLRYPTLTAFKLYVWARTNWLISDQLSPTFDPDRFYQTWPAVETLRNDISDLYRQIPGKEFWSRTVVDNILNQIKYYENCGFFIHPSLPQGLRTELGQMLEECAQMGAMNSKTTSFGSTSGAKLDLYLNEIAYTNNIIMIYRDEIPLIVYSTMDNPNFLRSQDPVFCQRMNGWIKQIETCSFHTGNELHRLNLFRDLNRKIIPGFL